jgi:hypothetical protein
MHGGERAGSVPRPPRDFEQITGSGHGGRALPPGLPTEAAPMDEPHLGRGAKVALTAFLLLLAAAVAVYSVAVQVGGLFYARGADVLPPEVARGIGRFAPLTAGGACVLMGIRSFWSRRMPHRIGWLLLAMIAAQVVVLLFTDLEVRSRVARIPLQLDAQQFSALIRVAADGGRLVLGSRSRTDIPQ